MKAVILVGGEGTRLRPLTYNRPKPMVPILNRPFLEHMIEYLKGHDVTDIILALCYLPDRIREHFGDGSDFGVRLTYVVEDCPLGTAGAVKNVERYLDGAFFVFNGDVFTDLDLTEMMTCHQRMGATVTIALTPVDNPTIYGVVETSADGRVQRFVEKPGPDEVTTNMINAGTYIIEPRALQWIPSNGFTMFESRVFPDLVGAGEGVYSHRSDAYWIDIGTPAKYVKLHHDLLNAKTDKLSDDGWSWVDEGCDVHPQAQLEGPVVLGENCVIGPGARIRGPAAIGANCHIGEGSLVDRAILWRNSTLGRGVSARECVIAENVFLGDRSQVMEGSVLGDNVVVEAGERLARDTRLGAANVPVGPQDTLRRR